MNFADYPYYLFLGLIVSVTLFIPPRLRWILLLTVSILFYSYGRWSYSLLLLVSISIDYFCAIGIAGSRLSSTRKLFLCISIFTNLGILIFFKYLGDVIADWSWIEYRSTVMNLNSLDLLLPLGLSFYTLQSMGYTVDVFRRKIDPERHFGYFSLYVVFFPQLVAGPIERPERLIPQLRNQGPITASNIESGVFLILLGLVKKLVVADRMFLMLREMLAQPEALAGWQAIGFGMLAFWAVYMDISAYTDIARGSARLFGIDLMRNFNRPFIATSLGDFWQRWHISLTSWIMDYVYVPLARHLRARWFRHLCLVATFLLIGIWHGPKLTFILMGLLHGVGIVVERLVAASRFRWPDRPAISMIRWFRLQIVLSISGVLFLAPSLSDAMHIFSRVFETDNFWQSGLTIPSVSSVTFLGCLGSGMTFVILASEFTRRDVLVVKVRTLPVWMRVGALYCISGLVLMFAERSDHEFMYFQF